MDACRFGLVLIVIVAGCSKRQESPSYIDVSIPAGSAKASGPNAFDAYSALAKRAEDRANLSLDARDTQGNRRKVLTTLGPLLSELAEATSLPCKFNFEPVGPLETRPNHIGWLQLGRALVWRINQAADEENWDSAAHWTVVAMCFGIDLGGGSISDATLGYGIMDSARSAIAPFVAAMPASSLRIISHGLDRALQRLPAASVTIDNESIQMFTAVSEIQEAHKSGRTEELATQLFGESRKAIKALGSMKGKEVREFVQSLVNEANSCVEQMHQLAMVPGSRRNEVEIGLVGSAHTIALAYFSSGSPWLTIRDLTLARTRLLFLTAHLHLLFDETGHVPDSLSDVRDGLNSDPYTGMPMGFLPIGQDFVVYSYGVDGKDDRGDSDTERLRPDILLEDATL